MNVDPVMKRLVLFEGFVPYMYRCTGGEVTVGIGHAILSPNAALGLNWQQISTSVRPADDLIKADYEKVSAAPKGQIASNYESLTSIRMSDEAINGLANTDIVLFSGMLDRELPFWEEYPEPAQEALFDMGFNLGIGGLRKYVKMLSACGRGDWDTAAAESKRNGIPAARNEAIRQLFLDAKEV